VRRVLDHPALGRAPKLVLGGGSNLVLTRDPDAVVLRWRCPAAACWSSSDDAWIVEAGAGETWHDAVAWTLAPGLPGLENLALIPGTVGAAPVQNIGAYGLELKDRFDSLDAVDLVTGRSVTLDAARNAQFGYRDSVFKQAEGGLAGKSVITRVRLRLPRPWQPVLGYLDLQRRMAETGNHAPDARTLFDWVCAIRRAKLPDPATIGNAGSFFKNPVVSAEQCRDIIGRDPHIVHYPLPDGRVQAGRRLADRRLRLEGQVAWAAPASTSAGPGAGQPRRRQRRRGADAGPRHPGKRLRPLRHPPGARAGSAALRCRCPVSEALRACEYLG
jgi:UDP-N-acetylmuramate dehydrogenase